MNFEISTPDRFEMSQPTPLFDAVWATDREKRFETHLACRADLGVGERRYLIRLWNNFVYFTESPQEKSGAVWSCLEPVAETAEKAQELLARPGELGSWWREQVLWNKFGVVECADNASTEYLDSIYVWGCNGHGRIRLWWDDRAGEPFWWPAGPWNTQATILQAQADSQIWSLRRWAMHYGAQYHRGPVQFDAEESAAWRQSPVFGEKTLERVRTREVLPRHQGGVPLSWGRMSPEEAKALTTAIVQLDDASWGNTSLLEARLQSQTPNAPFSPIWEVWEPDDDYWPDPYPEGAIANILMALLQREFDPIGWDWPEVDSNRRAEQLPRWDFVPTCWAWQIGEATSRHEKLEAKLLLRDWLAHLAEVGMIESGDQELLLDVSRALSKAEEKELRRRLVEK